MNKEQLEKFLQETRNYPYFSSLYDIDMWIEDKKELIRDLEVLEILKPRIKLSNKTIKQAVFSDYNQITQEKEEKEIAFVTASGFVFKNSKEHKLLKEWLEK